MSSPVPNKGRLGVRYYSVVAALAAPCGAFYLPGVAPRQYDEGATVELMVDKLTSSKAQLPFGYYTLKYCTPPGGNIQHQVENLGEVLAGEEIENSPYVIKMKVNRSCAELCKQPLNKEERDKFRHAIDNEYMVNWIIDNLPAATLYTELSNDGKATQQVTLPGFPVGRVEDGHYYLHNNVEFRLNWHKNPEKYEGFRFVGFEVQPKSDIGCGLGPYELREENSDVTFSYSVDWIESDVRWALRWDRYLKLTNGGQVHWFSILNSTAIILFLSGMVGTILLRTLWRDIAKYNEVPTAEEAKEDAGWKLVHADVFRAPPHSTLLASLFGSGLQLLGMSAVTLIFAAAGFLSPANRGALLQSMLLMFTMMGYLAGYSAARLVKTWRETVGPQDLFTLGLYTGMLFPGIVFLVFFLLDLMLWSAGSSGAVPFTTLLAIMMMWFGISVPLVLLGTRMGLSKPPVELPCKVAMLPRSIPSQSAFSNPVLMSLVGGVLPFCAVFTELFFIMSSLWLHQFYYMFGFLVVALLSLVIICSEVSIGFTYLQLTLEDYRWWWTSALCSASSGIYLMMYSVVYFHMWLNITSSTATFLYYGYMALASTSFALLTGAIGLGSTFIFLRAIYGSIKID